MICSTWRDKKLFKVAVAAFVVSFCDVDGDGFGESFDDVEELAGPLGVIVPICDEVACVDDEIGFQFDDLFDDFSVSFGMGSAVTIDNEGNSISFRGDGAEREGFGFVVGG